MPVEPGIKVFQVGPFRRTGMRAPLKLRTVQVPACPELVPLSTSSMRSRARRCRLITIRSRAPGGWSPAAGAFQDLPGAFLCSVRSAMRGNPAVELMAVMLRSGR